MSQFTEHQVAQALACLREFEAQYLGDPVHGFNNPFRRAGVPAKDIGWACRLLKPGVTARGAPRIDIAAARRLLKELMATGQVEATGAQRTQHAGAPTLDCFALAGFAERLRTAQDAWLKRAEA